VSRAPTRVSRSISTSNSRKERPLDVDGLKTKIMADCEAWRTDTFLKKLRYRLLDDTTDEQEKKEDWMSLMEYALGKRKGTGYMEIMMKEPDSHVWSFCRDQWVSRIECRHCEDCDICYDDAWHCIACGKCKVGHWLVCDGCGGKSLTGALYGILEDGTSKDAHTTQGVLSLGRPKKRSRNVDYNPGLSSVSEVSHSQSLSVFNTTDIITTQTTPEAPADIGTRTCNCKDLCSTRRCICRRWGGQCKHDCKCNGFHAEASCLNIFDLNEDRFFGPALPGKCVPRATPCFTDYLEKALKMDFGSALHQKNSKVSVEYLETLLLADGNSMDMWDDLEALRETLKTLAVDSEERKAHLRRIFREGLSVEHESCFFFSFCQKDWEYVNDYTHCPTCKKCYSARSSWHCGVCKQCRHNGLDEPCHRCGGTSLDAGLRLAESRPDTQSSSRLRITESISEQLDESSSAVDEEVNLLPERDSSPVRSLLNGNSLATASRLGAQSTSKLPIARRRDGTLDSFSNATIAGPASLTVSNLSQHTHRSSHESSEYPPGAVSRYSNDLQTHGQRATVLLHSSLGKKTGTGCVCEDGCRSPYCPCAASGRLSSKNCTSVHGHRLCANTPYIMRNDRLAVYYFGSVQPHAEFHDCFKFRLEAVASGEMDMKTIEDLSHQFWYGLVSGRQFSSMKKLPDAPLEGELATWRDTTTEQGMPIGYPHERWLFRLALSKNYGEPLVWKFSFCEGKWICSAEWVHCVKCRRCHMFPDGLKRC
jgi:hypothetical protein